MPYCTRCNQQQNTCVINANELNCTTQVDNNFYGRGGECSTCPPGQKLEIVDSDPIKTEKNITCSNCEYNDLLANQTCSPGTIPIGCTNQDEIKCASCMMDMEYLYKVLIIMVQ